jgi:hypothetical protein
MLSLVRQKDGARARLWSLLRPLRSPGGFSTRRTDGKLRELCVARGSENGWMLAARDAAHPCAGGA